MPHKPSRTPVRIEEEPCTVRLSRNDLEDLLRELNRPEPLDDSRRENARLRYHHPLVHARLSKTGGSLLLACRNISRGGMALLHCAYVYVGTPCSITLHDLAGATHEVKGTVVHCRHVSGRVHEIGVRFNDVIPLRRFIRIDPLSEQYSLESFDTAQMRGNVLLVTMCALSRKLVAHWLRETRVKLTIPEDPGAAAEALNDPFDILILDFDAPDIDAAAFAEHARAAGTSKLIVVSGQAQPDARRAIAALKPVGFLSKPLREQKVIRALGEFLVLSDELHDASSAENTEARNELAILAADFARELHKMADEIRSAVDRNDGEGFSRACAHIRSVAPVLGFAELADAAAKASEHVREGVKLRADQPEFTALIDLCVNAKAA